MSKLRIAIVAVAVILIIVVVAAIMGDSSLPGRVPAAKPSPDSTFEPITFTGSSSETTSPFRVTTREWVIGWSYETEYPKDALFSFAVYPKDEITSYVEILMPTSNTHGSTYCYAGPGEYYIKVSPANIQKWEITISPA